MAQLNTQRCALLLLALCTPALSSRAGEGQSSLWKASSLDNGSFETIEGSLPKGWSTATGASLAASGKASAPVVDTLVKRSGARSLRFDVRGDVLRFLSLQSSPVKVVAGRPYRLSGWMRTEDVRREGRQFPNCNLYVSFRDTDNKVLRIGRYPVVGTEVLMGTNEWRRVETRVVAPARAVHALVGCFVSCTGRAWFDDVALSEQRQIPWKTRRSRRFVFHYEGKDAPTRRDIAGNEKHLARLEKLLGVSQKERIPFYKYASNERKAAITGSAGNAHVEGGAIHSIFASDRHEVVHILTRSWGDTVALFGEGIAVYLSGAWHGLPVHDAARKLARSGKLSPLTALLDTRSFRGRPDTVTYPQSGSFCGFLIEKHGGIDRFRKIYTYTDPLAAPREIPGRVERVYGKELATLEREWLAFLGKKS